MKVEFPKFEKSILQEVRGTSTVTELCLGIKSVL